FKWFGSLGNLSFRRKSDTGKEASTKYEQRSVDDDDMRPRCPSYARSSEMYTHMGTMPRPQKKKDKSAKAKGQETKSLKTKTKTKSTNLNRSQSMRCSDHVIESPLLSVLNSQALSSLQEKHVDSKLTQEPQKAETKREAEALSTEKIQKEPDKTSSKPKENPAPPPEALPKKPALPRKGSLPVKISAELQEEKTSNLTGHQEEERKTSPDAERLFISLLSQKRTTDSEGEYVEKLMKESWNLLKNLLKESWNLLKKLMKESWNLLKKLMKEPWNLLKKLMKESWNLLKKLMKEFWNLLKKLMKDFGNPF
ncbi:hypothetical protein QTP70_026061, partial [Hemibagrus guttatus]